MPSPAPLDVVFFELRGLRCALPLAVVRKVLPMRGVTPVPLSPPVVRGIAPVHGFILPILDLGVCFSPAGDETAEAATYRSHTDKLLLVETARDVAGEATRAALAVDRVMGIGTVDEQHSRLPPSRPPFLSATVLDASGPALLLDIGRTLDYVKDAIGTVIGS
ncbi:MAG: chemotaxis protein CheW [Deltaproteobacteria bacterium]|nr:chemotaxis protein CheW [Deltaproteobacteria bacterium]